MKVQIRTAKPTDTSFLAHIMLLAARSHLERGFWDIALNAPEAECLQCLTALTLTTTPSWAHYSKFFVAEVDGTPAAALCAYDPRQAGMPMLMQAIGEVAQQVGWGAAESNALWERFAPIATCLSDEIEDAWIIENVATLAMYRRRGLTNALLTHVLEDGRRQGYRLAQISVLIGNTPAQQAYEKVGFHVQDEKRHPSFAAVVGEPGMRRLLLPF